MLGLVAPHDHGEERRLLLPPTRHRHPEHSPSDPTIGVADPRVIGRASARSRYARCVRVDVIGSLPANARQPSQLQKSMLACTSVVAPQNSVSLPSRIWLTLATGTSIDLPPREADSVHSTTACSSLASTS